MSTFLSNKNNFKKSRYEKELFFSSEPGQVSISKIDEYNEENIKKKFKWGRYSHKSNRHFI